MATRLSLFGPVVGSHVFDVGSSVTFTLSGKTSTGYYPILGYVPVAAFNGIFSTAISNPPVPVATDLKTGTTGVSYSVTISVQGGTGPFVFVVASGSLPTSLSLNSSTGVISGTPTATGTFTFTIKVTDTNGAVGSTAFDITIVAPSSGGGGNYGFLT